MNTWAKILKNRKSLIMQFIKSRIFKSLATAGKAFVAEDVDGLRDGADDKQLETHIQRKLGNTECLTITGQPQMRFSGPIRKDQTMGYDVDDDVEVVEDIDEDSRYVFES